MFSNFVQRAVVQSIPLLYGSTGEILTEKSGNLNLGIPGIMYVGAISGVIGGYLYENNTSNFNNFLGVLIPFACCILGAAVMGLIYCFLTVTLRANQNVTGLAMTTFGVGFGNFFGGSLMKLTKSQIPTVTVSKCHSAFSKHLTLQSDNRFVQSLCDIFLSYGFLMYLGIIIAILTGLVLKKTRIGLHLRAVGENPATADAAGINVNRYKYLATCIGSVIAGLGGLYYIMDYASGVWANDGFGDRGWLAIALVIFAIWRPALGIIGSLLFGAMYMVSFYVNASMAMKPVYEMLPYVVTLIVLILISFLRKRETQPPAHLGLPYFREER